MVIKQMLMFTYGAGIGGERNVRGVNGMEGGVAYLYFNGVEF